MNGGGAPRAGRWHTPMGVSGAGAPRSCRQDLGGGELDLFLVHSHSFGALALQGCKDGRCTEAGSSSVDGHTCPTMKWASFGNSQLSVPGGIQVRVRVQLWIMIMIIIAGNEKACVIWRHYDVRSVMSSSNPASNPITRINDNICPILHLSKLRLREIKQFTQGRVVEMVFQ